MCRRPGLLRHYVGKGPLLAQAADKLVDPSHEVGAGPKVVAGRQYSYRSFLAQIIDLGTIARQPTPQTRISCRIATGFASNSFGPIFKPLFEAKDVLPRAEPLEVWRRTDRAARRSGTR